MSHPTDRHSSVNLTTVPPTLRPSKARIVSAMVQLVSPHLLAGIVPWEGTWNHHLPREDDSERLESRMERPIGRGGSGTMWNPERSSLCDSSLPPTQFEHRRNCVLEYSKYLKHSAKICRRCTGAQLSRLSPLLLRVKVIPNITFTCVTQQSCKFPIRFIR